MTREEHIKVCEKCINRKMDWNQGLICSISGEKACFDLICINFLQDDTVINDAIEKKEGFTIAGNEQLLQSEIIDKLKLEQNLPLGILTGLVIGIIGAVIWGAITVATGFQIGFMAVGIGAAVGIGIREFGKGIDRIFGFSGAVISIFSCILGNFFYVIGYVANEEGLGYIETIINFNYNVLPEIMTSTFSPIDIIFYAIALRFGYKFSFRTLKEKDIKN